MATRPEPDGDPGVWHEIFLNHRAASASSAAESLVSGHSVVVQSSLASSSECAILRAFAAKAHDKLYSKPSPENWAGPGSVVGRARMALARMASTSSADANGHALCEALLMRAMTRLEESCSSLVSTLFGGVPRTCTANDGLTFSQGEPAINVYDRGGDFKAHTDKQSLTILLALSEADEFEGGGTAFYSDEVVASDQSNIADLGDADATMILRPEAGTALCFGGQVVHSGVKVDSGRRMVLVASFSCREQLVDGVKVNSVTRVPGSAAVVRAVALPAHGICDPEGDCRGCIL